MTLKKKTENFRRSNRIISHVNMKRKINAVKRDLTIKRVETQSKTFFRRMQTLFDMRPIDMRLKMF